MQNFPPKQSVRQNSISVGTFTWRIKPER